MLNKVSNAISAFVGLDKVCIWELPSEDDYVYCDPPYAHTKGMYYGALDCGKLWDWLRGLKCPYALSFDGIAGVTDNTYAVPEDIYTKHELLFSGNSSFRRVIGKLRSCAVRESLYLKQRQIKNSGQMV